MSAVTEIPLPPAEEAPNPNAYMFESMYLFLFAQGQEIEVRGTKCKELEDVMLRFSTEHSPLTSFKARNLNLNYCKKEMLWYLGADPFDTSIEQHATMWQKLRQPDGSYYSNYGQYLFNRHQNPSHFMYCVNELMNDKYTRRACVTLLQPHHLFHDNIDTVCTYAMNFRIRDDKLNMSVMMRSNDAIFGTTNDVFCFWVIYQMMYALVKQHYPELQRGRYTHFVNSLHVYERHYDMLGKLIEEGCSGYYDVRIPELDFKEAWQMVNLRPDPTKPSGPFMEWLFDETDS